MAAPNKPRPVASGERTPWSPRRKAVVWTIVAVVALAIFAVLIWIAYATGPGAKTSATHPSGNPTSSAGPTATPIAVPTSAPLAQPAAIKPGLTAQITKFESVEGIATTPGTVSAPSVRITLQITNNTSKSASLATTVITSNYGTTKTPALQLFSPGGVSLPASVPAGKSVTGVYLFSIPVADRGDVEFEVDYAVGVTPLVFQGTIPK